MSLGGGRTARTDPWLRTHERVGGEIVKVAPQSVTISGTVGEWEEWAEMAFPETGAHVVPGALVPVEVDRERDEGLYLEPNVWVVHAPFEISKRPGDCADDVQVDPGQG